MTNTALLDKYIRDSGLKKSKIAKALGITVFCLQQKRNNVREFKASEIKKLCELLGIHEGKDKEAIFYA